MHTPSQETTGGGEIQGVVHFMLDESGSAPTPASLSLEDLHRQAYVYGTMAGMMLVELMAAKDGQVQASERAERAENIEPMTGLYTREYLIDRYEELSTVEELRGRRKTDVAPLEHSLAVVDADHFKSINDTYGHDVGDAVLVRLATVLKESVHRPSDVVARIGGEEFCILLPGAGPLEAAEIMEKLRRSVNDDPALYSIIEKAANDRKGAEILRVSVSVGVTKLKFKDGYRKDYRDADQNLLKAKRSGRNQVIVD